MLSDTLTISLDDGKGKMYLYLPEFFPCNVTTIRNLDKKCIRSDTWNNDRNQILCDLASYLSGRINETEDKKARAKLQKNYETVLKLL